MTGKIIRSLFSLAMLVLVIGAALFSGILYGYYEKQSFASLAQEAEQLQQTMEYVSPEQMRSADRITLISPDGTVLYDSVARADAMENHLSREEVAQALREGTGKSSHYSSTVLKKNLYYALRLDDGNIFAPEPGAKQPGGYAAEYGMAHCCYGSRAFAAGGGPIRPPSPANHPAYQCHFPG